ncbi:MAG TPA: TIGR03435 family protein [Terriglobia bacterium]|jgi:uncharacterized protein (TIGR03435 family)
MRFGIGRMTAKHVSPSTLIDVVLSPLLARPIEDRTGLTKHYDFTLQWTPNVGEGRVGPFGITGPTTAAGPVAAPAAQPGPSLYTALEEQLGLRLESTRGAVDVIVIDHAEKPDAN